MGFSENYTVTEIIMMMLSGLLLKDVLLFTLEAEIDCFMARSFIFWFYVGL